MCKFKENIQSADTYRGMTYFSIIIYGIYVSLVWRIENKIINTIILKDKRDYIIKECVM